MLSNQHQTQRAIYISIYLYIYISINRYTLVLNKRPLPSLRDRIKGISKTSTRWNPVTSSSCQSPVKAETSTGLSAASQHNIQKDRNPWYKTLLWFLACNLHISKFCLLSLSRNLFRTKSTGSLLKYGKELSASAYCVLHTSRGCQRCCCESWTNEGGRQ